MKKKELPSLRFNSISWELFRLGENKLLLQAPLGILIDQIHESSNLIKNLLGDTLTDIVPAYTSIALFYSSGEEQLLKKLAAAKNVSKIKSGARNKIEIPICYELGLDLDEIALHAGFSKQEVINLHLKGHYIAILIGFTPGFIYMDGLDRQLECPRKSNPRKHLESGSIGIGGVQTGIYSLPSPGGWNIIGRTPLQLFSVNKQPPMDIQVGTEISYKRITKKEFESWGS